MDINNSMQEAIKKAGIIVPEKPDPIKKEKQTIEIKINTSFDNVEAIRLYEEKYSGAPSKFEYMAALDGISSRVDGIVQYIKDVSEILSKAEGKELKESSTSLSWALRFLKGTLKLSNDEEEILNRLIIRNLTTHDYVNSKVYKEEIANFFSSGYVLNALESLMYKMKEKLEEM